MNLISPPPSRLSPPLAQKLNLAGDVALVVASSFLAGLDHGCVHWMVAIAMAATATFILYAGSLVLRHYDAANGRGWLGDIALTLVLLSSVAGAMWLLRLVFPRYAVTTDPRVFAAVLAPTVLLLRFRAVGLRLWRSRPIDAVLVVGIGSLGRLTQREIRDGGRRRAVIGYLRFDNEAPGPRLEAPLLGEVGALEGVLRRRVVNEVYLASNASNHREDVQAAIRLCETLGVPFALPACGYRLTRARPAGTPASPDGYIHYLSVRHRPIQAALKRVLDIVASVVALFLLSPLLLVTAVAVRLTSRGPALFKQERVGQYGRRFHLLKFRSMVQDAEQLRARLEAHNEQSGPVFKMQNDPRVTPLGRLLRKYSVDELPQLVNVLRGDMSLVGPRPPLPSEVQRYEGWQLRRLSVRPGLTCTWQVSGRNLVSFEEWMLLDMRYIDHWTLAKDLRLILRTVPVVLTGRGAS